MSMGRLTVLFALGGFLVGLFIGLFVFNFYLTSYPQATDTDKGLMVIVLMVVIISFTLMGYKLGEKYDP